MKSDLAIRRRILLDVTISATTDLQSGIQRVVRNIARESEALSKELNVDCVPIVCHGETMWPVGFDGRRPWDQRFANWLFACWMGLHRWIARCLDASLHGTPDPGTDGDQQVNNSPSASDPISAQGSLQPNHRITSGEKYLLFLSRLRKLLLPKTPIRWIKGIWIRLTRKQLRIRQGDILVLLDASWNIPVAALIDQAKSNGVPVVTVIYDLIPVRHPRFHNEALRTVFSGWLNLVAEKSDFFIGRSRTVKNDLMDYVSQSGRAIKKSRFESFQLGADIVSAASNPAQIQWPAQFPNFEKLLSSYYLAVGTIEPRKNHTFLLDTFDLLWKTHPHVPLFIAGKPGWLCKDIEARIRTHPQLNQSLFFFDDANDQQLRSLYKNAKALIFPSIVEGFGLPIVEAFHHEIPVLASDTPIHREVGGVHCEFFDLKNPHALAQNLTDIEDQKRQFISSKGAPVTHWNESCRQFLSKIISFPQLQPTVVTTNNKKRAA